MELLTQLGINWQLLIAQIVNFGIVVAVLTYLVYKPLLSTIDARRERTRKSVEDAKKIESQKRDMEVFRVEQMKKIDAECGAFLDQAKKDAEATKEQILTLAQKEADRLLTKGEERLAEERSRVFSEVQNDLSTIIVRLTEKILVKEFTPEDQKKWIGDIQKELPSLLR